jgi:hypothetical protein
MFTKQVLRRRFWCLFGVFSFFFTHLNQKPLVIYAGQGLFLGLPLILGPTPWEYGPW